MEEFIDIVDENGKELNISESRKLAHKKGLWHKASGVIIINKKNEVLLQQRSILKVKNGGLWDISASGHIPSGETPEKSLIREIKEELRVSIKQKDLKLLGIYKRQELHNNGNFIENEFDYIYTLSCDIDLLNIKLQKTEVSDIKYFSKNEIISLINQNLLVKRVCVWDDLFLLLDKN